MTCSITCIQRAEDQKQTIHAVEKDKGQKKKKKKRKKRK